MFSMFTRGNETAQNPRNSDFPTNPPGRGTGEKTSPIHGAKDEVASSRIVTADVSPGIKQSGWWFQPTPGGLVDYIQQMRLV